MKIKKYKIGVVYELVDTNRHEDLYIRILYKRLGHKSRIGHLNLDETVDIDPKCRYANQCSSYEYPKCHCEPELCHLYEMFEEEEEKQFRASQSYTRPRSPHKEKSH